MTKKVVKGELLCPVCRKEKFIVYTDTTGQTSSHCARCGRLLLLNYDQMEALPVKPGELVLK